MKHIHKLTVGLLLMLSVVGATFSLAVTTASAQTAGGSADPKDSNFQIVPCTGVEEKDANGVVIGKKCDFNSLVEMANRVIKFLLYLSIPLVLGIIVFTAFQYLTANGNPVKLDKAKHMIKYVIIGLLWILGSFILVYTVLDNLLSDNIKNDQQGIWNSYFKQ